MEAGEGGGKGGERKNYKWPFFSLMTLSNLSHQESENLKSVILCQPDRTAVTKKINCTPYWEGQKLCAQLGNGRWEVVQPLGRSLWGLCQELKLELPCGVAIAP